VIKSELSKVEFNVAQLENQHIVMLDLGLTGLSITTIKYLTGEVGELGSLIDELKLPFLEGKRQLKIIFFPRSEWKQ